MKQQELDVILEKHNLWVKDEAGGERADLEGANLEGAYLKGANLMDANLRNANLRNANLMDANLWGANGNLKNIKSIGVEKYPVVYTDAYLQIGCERHPITDWWEFEDRRILEMDGKSALQFWHKWKNQIKEIIEMSPAEPTGYIDGDANGSSSECL